MGANGGGGGPGVGGVSPIEPLMAETNNAWPCNNIAWGGDLIGIVG